MSISNKIYTMPLTYFDVLKVPKLVAGQSAEAYNNVLCRAFEGQPVTPERQLAYMVLTRQYDLYVQLHCTKTLYEVLGVPKNASDDEIKKAYRTWSLKVHPDRWMTAEAALQSQAVFNQQRVSYAFQILSQRRSEYNAAGCPYDMNASNDGDDDDFSDFNDDLWAASGSEAEESSAEESDCFDEPPPKRAPPTRGRGGRGRTTQERSPPPTTEPGSKRGRGGAARGAGRGAARGGAGRGGAARGGAGRGGAGRGGANSTGRGRGGKRQPAEPEPTAPPPPDFDGLTKKRVVTASLFQLYRGFTASVMIETSIQQNGTWVAQLCPMQIAVPPRTAPGLLKILRHAGLYRPGLASREDVHVHLELDTEYTQMRGQDLVLQHSIDLDVAIRGTGTLHVKMPDQETEQFQLNQVVHDQDEIAYQGRGLKNLETGFVGCIILRLQVKYPAWTTAQRLAVADFIQTVQDVYDDD